MSSAHASTSKVSAPPSTPKKANVAKPSSTGMYTLEATPEPPSQPRVDKGKARAVEPEAETEADAPSTSTPLLTPPATPTRARSPASKTTIEIEESVHYSPLPQGKEHRLMLFTPVGDGKVQAVKVIDVPVSEVIDSDKNDEDYRPSKTKRVLKTERTSISVNGGQPRVSCVFTVVDAPADHDPAEVIHLTVDDIEACNSAGIDAHAQVADEEEDDVAAQDDNADESVAPTKTTKAAPSSRAVRCSRELKELAKASFAAKDVDLEMKGYATRLRVACIALLTRKRPYTLYESELLRQGEMCPWFPAVKKTRATKF